METLEGPTVILRLTRTTTELVRESSAEGSLLGKQVRALLVTLTVAFLLPLPLPREARIRCPISLSSAAGA